MIVPSFGSLPRRVRAPGPRLSPAASQRAERRRRAWPSVWTRRAHPARGRWLRTPSAWEAIGSATCAW